MSISKKCFAVALFFVAAGWAQVNSEINNVCDTLALSKQSMVTLVPAYIEESGWVGQKDLSKKDSSWVVQHKDYSSLSPLHNNMKNYLPLAIQAGCSESYNQPSAYASWSSVSKKWSYEDGNNIFSTYIMDSRMVDFGSYNEHNSYNFLAWVRGDELGESFHAGEIMVSTTKDFRFDWWYAWVSYTTKRDSVVKSGDSTKVYTRIKNYVSEAPGIDSLAALNSARSSLTVPDTISQIEVKVVHIPLVDERSLKELASSSSVAGESSSSSKVESSSSKDELSSSSVAVSSSSDDEEGTTAIASRFADSQKFGEVRQVRRLDGSVAKNGALTPGVYYVKGENGAWKKRIVLPQ